MQPRAMGEPIDLPEVPLRMVMQDFVDFEDNYGSPVLATPGARFSTCAAVADEFRQAEARA